MNFKEEEEEIRQQGNNNDERHIGPRGGSYGTTHAMNGTAEDDSIGPFGDVVPREAIEPIFTAADLKTLTMTVPLDERSDEENYHHRRGGGRKNHRQQRHQQGATVVVTVGGKEVGMVPAVEVATTAVPIMPGQIQGEDLQDKESIPKGECSVLVKGIPMNATNAVIRAHFSVCGPVPRVSILKKPVTGDQSDLAWVSFKTEKAAQKALLLSGSSFLLENIAVWPKESPEAREAVESMNNESFEAAMMDPFGGMMNAWSGGGGGGGIGGRGRGRGMRGGGAGWGGRGDYSQQQNSFKYVRQPEGGVEAMDAENTGASGFHGSEGQVKQESEI